MPQEENLAKLILYFYLSMPNHKPDFVLVMKEILDGKYKLTIANHSIVFEYKPALQEVTFYIDENTNGFWFYRLLNVNQLEKTMKSVTYRIQLDKAVLNCQDGEVKIVIQATEILPHPYFPDFPVGILTKVE